ncbi:MAG: AMIN domain-containing protein, partial [Pseudomonadota bacterium]
MGKRLGIDQKGIAFLLITSALALSLLSGCATPPKNAATSADTIGPMVKEIRVNPSPSGTTVEIVNSRPIPYTAFRLIEPPRVILDIRGEAGGDLQRVTAVNDGNIQEIRFEAGETQAMTTRMVATLTGLLDYEVTSEDNIIRLVLTRKTEIPPPAAMKEARVSVPVQEKDAEKKPFAPSEPRVIFQPRPSDLNQIIGLDFMMLERGKSRVIVTTDKKAPYKLDREGAKTLILHFSDTTIPPLLLKEIDTSQFSGALEKIVPDFSATQKEVSLAFRLREMVPFHVKQTEKGLTMDFGMTDVKPPERKIIPLQLAQAQIPVPIPEKPSLAKPMETTGPGGAAGPGKKYKGEPMYLDFVNADVTHILRLINDVSKENIIWDPAIAGKKVSMILKGVPWDEALELILKNNDLAK